MISFFANRLVNVNQKENLYWETVSFYVQYLFSEQSIYYCWLSHYLPLWNSINTLPDKVIITYDHFFEPDDRGDSMEQMMENCDMVKKIRARKHKTRQEIDIINRYNTLMDKTRIAVIDNMELFLRSAGIWEWLGLFDEKTAMPIGFNMIDDIDDNEEDELIEYLRHEISETNCFLFLNYYIIHIFKSINIVKPENTVIEPGALSFYTIPLFSFPYCICLEKEKMKIIRSGIQAKIAGLSAIFESLSVELRKEEFNDALKEKCRQFYEQLLPEIKIMQQHLDNIVYFQHRINAAEDYQLITLNLGIAPVTTIIDYYVQSKNLLPYAATALKQKLSMNVDIDKCSAFLYWSAEVKKSF